MKKYCKKDYGELPRDEWSQGDAEQDYLPPGCPQGHPAQGQVAGWVSAMPSFAPRQLLLLGCAPGNLGCSFLGVERNPLGE